MIHLRSSLIWLAQARSSLIRPPQARASGQILSSLLLSSLISDPYSPGLLHKRMIVTNSNPQESKKSDPSMITTESNPRESRKAVPSIIPSVRFSLEWNLKKSNSYYGFIQKTIQEIYKWIEKNEGEVRGGCVVLDGEYDFGNYFSVMLISEDGNSVECLISLVNLYLEGIRGSNKERWLFFKSPHNLRVLSFFVEGGEADWLLHLDGGYKTLNCAIHGSLSRSPKVIFANGAINTIIDCLSEISLESHGEELAGQLNMIRSIIIFLCEGMRFPFVRSIVANLFEPNNSPNSENYMDTMHWQELRNWRKNSEDNLKSLFYTGKCAIKPGTMGFPEVLKVRYRLWGRFETIPRSEREKFKRNKVEEESEQEEVKREEESEQEEVKSERGNRNKEAVKRGDFGKRGFCSFGYVKPDILYVLGTYPNPLQDNPAYSVVKQYFVNHDDTVTQTIVVHNGGPRGTHFRRAGPRQGVYFESDEVNACIVTCGGLCPGLNTVIRELVCGLFDMYGVTKVLGIEGGYRGFYARNTINLTPKIVNDIHKRGGTILGTSRGGHDTEKIVDSIIDRGINQVYIIGGDGTQKGASVIFEEIQRRGVKVAVVGIPKTIDNDIEVIDKSFGFDTAVEEAQRAINAAHVEAESVENGIGLVKLMGRHSGFIAMYATLASRDVDCCLIPESPFYLDGKGGLLEFIEKRLKEQGHMVIVVAEGAGQEFIAQSIRSMDTSKDASGNKLLLDVGLWLSQKIKEYFMKKPKMPINLKYIDPTYMIRAVPSNASDNVYCSLLAHSALHGAMAGYTGFTVGPVNGRHAYIPFYRITEKQKKVVITDRMWARLLSSTNQPSFLTKTHIDEYKRENGLMSPITPVVTTDIINKDKKDAIQSNGTLSI